MQIVCKLLRVAISSMPKVFDDKPIMKHAFYVHALLSGFVLYAYKCLDRHLCAKARSRSSVYMIQAHFTAVFGKESTEPGKQFFFAYHCIEGRSSSKSNYRNL